MICRKDNNKAKCACIMDCKIKGECCICIENHKEIRMMPFCFIPAELQKMHSKHGISWELFSELVSNKKL